MTLLEEEMPHSVGEPSEGASLGEQDASATASTAVAMMARGAWMTHFRRCAGAKYLLSLP